MVWIDLNAQMGRMWKTKEQKKSAHSTLNHRGGEYGWKGMCTRTSVNSSKRNEIWWNVCVIFVKCDKQQSSNNIDIWWVWLRRCSIFSVNTCSALENGLTFYVKWVFFVRLPLIVMPLFHSLSLCLLPLSVLWMADYFFSFAHFTCVRSRFHTHTHSHTWMYLHNRHIS